MGTLELMTDMLQDVANQLSSIKQRLDELEIIQESDDILWTKDNLKKHMQFKTYDQVKLETQKAEFPKVIIGRTERYPKKLVIQYFNDLAKDRHPQQQLLFKGSKSALYQ